jgi:hypothetical protein
MSAENKAATKVTEVKGKVKKETGAAIGNEQMEAEGKADQAKGNSSRPARRSRTLSRSDPPAVHRPVDARPVDARPARP